LPDLTSASTVLRESRRGTIPGASMALYDRQQ
jgi:hypothetical protein